MNWKLTSFNMQTAGKYAVTKSENPKSYFAWYEQENLGRFDTADEARAACEGHLSANPAVRVG